MAIRIVMRKVKKTTKKYTWTHRTPKQIVKAPENACNKQTRENPSARLYFRKYLLGPAIFPARSVRKD